MQETFTNDPIDQIVETALNEELEQWRKEGLSDAKILQKLDSIDLSKIY